MRSFVTSAAAALLGCSFVCSSALPAGPGGFTYSLDRNKIEPGQRARLELRLPLEAVGLKEIEDETELPQIRDDLLVDAPGLQILDRDFRRERNALIWRYDITLYQAGEATVPPVEIRLGPHSFSSEAQKLEVVATRQSGDEALRPEFEAVSPPWRVFRWLRWVLLFGALLAAWHYGRRYWRKIALRRALRPAVATTTPPEPLHVWLRRELSRLKALLETAPAPAVVDETTSVLREYFARRDKVPARAWTTDEMRRKLKGDAAAEEIVSVLAMCDVLKFSVDKNRPKEIAAETIERSEKALLP